MKEQEFKDWLKTRGIGEKGIQNKISYCKRIEESYEDLDILFEKDECSELLRELTYTKLDESNFKKVIHKIPLNKGANIRTATASYKSALNTYVLFLSEFLHKTTYINNTKRLEVVRLLKTIGKSTFIKYYNEFKNKNKEQLHRIFDKNRGKWSESSIKTKINTGIRIFEENLEKEALKITISSCQVDKETVKKANEVYYSEFSEVTEISKYIFIRPEFAFGEDIIKKLFYGYKILKQYRVNDYKIDWYIPELNLAIEFDEKHHKRQKKEDIERQKYIEKKMGCKFLRYKY